MYVALIWGRPRILDWGAKAPGFAGGLEGAAPSKLINNWGAINQQLAINNVNIQDNMIIESVTRPSRLILREIKDGGSKGRSLPGRQGSLGGR